MARLQGELAFGGRRVLIAYLGIAGFLCAYATWVLWFEVGSSRVARALAIFVTEPLATSCVVAILTILAPDSLAARFFGAAVKRASIVAVLLVTFVIAAIAGSVGWALWEYFRARS